MVKAMLVLTINNDASGVNKLVWVVGDSHVGHEYSKWKHQQFVQL